MKVNLCWICESAEATTREHLIKKTDVVDVFGLAFSQKSRVIKTYEELDETVSKDSIIIQGSNSKELK